MPKLSVRGKNPADGGGWKPLPSGTYDIQIDKIEETTSKNNNPQLKMAAHVVDGPHDQKKVTLWYSLVENALWKLEALCEAAGIDYSCEELDETDPETGKPLVEFELDTDDLIGCIVTYDVTEYKHQGKEQNRFENERAPEGSEPAKSKAKSDDSDDDADDSDDDGDDTSEAAEEPEDKEPPKTRGRRTRRARA